MKDPKEIVKPFYTRCLTVNTSTSLPAEMERLLSDDFESISSVEIKTKNHLIGQLQHFWKLIPDMTWSIQDIVAEGNQVVVRSLASGKPHGDFMGLKTDGTKSFKIMTIDMHTVSGGKILKVYHLEDWPTALKQLAP